ncbi:hypothetical protein L228DRAFT_58472 [Xylona heveae TC161]|uniref:Uncharacterized protein n=1 Tax=Xylona heveae (strain CBS 132557 / TC161) TaxID=1328760 RepID=A0A165IHV9_XYLHT|nr:hypothetical protein L228DRAFT_58472 [Xylona heveae TC161]KZF24922.1 hypothetical protein L228DRAFT_58472 [Xylona heveae TC161]
MRAAEWHLMKGLCPSRGAYIARYEAQLPAQEAPLLINLLWTFKKMYSVTHDSELMVQQVAAVAVPNSSFFSTVSDENGHPMVFSIGNDKKFYIFKEATEGHYLLSDFGLLLGFNENYIAHALSVSQDASLNLFVILAIEDSNASSSDDRKPSLPYVLKPFSPANYDLLDPANSDLRQLILPQKGDDSGLRISTIFTIGSTGGDSYPPVLVAYQPLEYINKKEDLSRVSVSSDLSSWTLTYDVDLPEDASKILALQPLVVPYGDEPMTGLAALYILQDAPQLIFMSNDGKYQVALQCPEDARSLAAVTNAENFSDLLVGGVGLRHFKAIECLRKNSAGTEISAEGVFASIQELYVAQSSSGVTVWAADIRQSVGYLTASTDFMDVGSPMPVIPRQQGGMFSVFKSATDGYEQLLVSDNAGALSLIRHDPVLGLWKAIPFYTPALEKVFDIRCYTTQITVFNAEGKPQIDSQVLLKSSGYVDILVNGLSVQANPSGVPLFTDQDGLLTLVVPTDGISSNSFTIATKDDASDAEGALPIDPTAKVYDALSKIQTGDDLKNAKTQLGQPLLQKELSDNDIDQAAKAIGVAISARDSLLVKNGLIKKSKAAALHNNVRFGHNLEKLEGSPRGIWDLPSSAWHWFCGLLDDIWSWAIEFADGAYSFLARIGDVVYRWTLNTLEMIGNALTWVFEKILEIVETIIEWIGFIFDWKDIQATHRSIVSLTNGALDTWAEKANLASDAIEAYFDGLADVLQNVNSNSLPEKLGSAPADNEVVEASRSENAAMDSTKVKWSQYQCTHGGAFKGAVIHDTRSAKAGGTPFEEFWSDVLSPLIGTFEDVSSDIGMSIFEIFNPADSISPKQALSKLGTNVLLDLLDGIKKIGSGLAKLGSSLLEDFKSALNYKITIPIFSTLYKKFISGGSDLTVLDGLALILAIPVTIATKLITGEKPPDMTIIDYSDLVYGVVSKDVTMQFNRFANVTTLSCRPIISAIELVESVFGLHFRFETGTAKQLARLPRQHPQGRQLKGAADLAKKYWQDMFAVVATLSTIPRNPDLPAYGVRWGSWAVSALNRATSMAIRRVDSASSVVLKRWLGVQKVVLGAVNYGLIISIKVEEFENVFPDKVEALIVLDCVSGTFDLVGCTCDGAAQFDPDPDTAAALGLASTVTTVFSVVVSGSTYVTRAAEGQYNDMIPFI